MNLEDQYDRIFKYLYFRLHDRHIAEDLTQEAFLRFLLSRTYRDENGQLLWQGRWTGEEDLEAFYISIISGDNGRTHGGQQR